MGDSLTYLNYTINTFNYVCSDTNNSSDTDYIYNITNANISWSTTNSTSIYN